MHPLEIGRNSCFEQHPSLQIGLKFLFISHYCTSLIIPGILGVGVVFNTALKADDGKDAESVP